MDGILELKIALPQVGYFHSGVHFSWSPPMKNGDWFLAAIVGQDGPPSVEVFMMCFEIQLERIRGVREYEKCLNIYGSEFTGTGMGPTYSSYYGTGI